MAFNDIDNERLAQLLNTKKGQEAYAKADVSYALDIAKSSEPEVRVEEVKESAEVIVKSNKILQRLKRKPKAAKSVPMKSTQINAQGAALYNAEQSTLTSYLNILNKGGTLPPNAGETGQVVQDIVGFNAGLNKRNAEEVMQSQQLTDTNIDNVMQDTFDGVSETPIEPEVDVNGTPIPDMPTSTGKNNGAYKTPNVQKAAKKHAKRKKDSNYSYSATTIDMGGTTMNISREETDFGLANLHDERSPIENTEALIQKVTKAIESRVGDWSRVKSFAVVSGQLLIDGVIHAPKITKRLDRTKYISGVVDYLEAGCLAGLFDWSTLYDATNIRYMWFDTDYSVELGTFLNDGVPFDIPYYFQYFDKLQHLTICNNTLTREELESHEEEKRSKKNTRNTSKPMTDEEWESATPQQRNYESLYQTIKRNRRSFDVTATTLYNSLLNGYNLSPQKGTQAMQDFAIGGLSNYVRNKGNKNLLVFGLGTVGMSALAAGSLGLNLATHLTTGVVKTTANLIGSFFAPRGSKGFIDNSNGEDITE